jgi:hypothetical protein
MIKQPQWDRYTSLLENTQARDIQFTSLLDDNQVCMDLQYTSLLDDNQVWDLFTSLLDDNRM